MDGGYAWSGVHYAGDSMGLMDNPDSLVLGECRYNPTYSRTLYFFRALFLNSTVRLVLRRGEKRFGRCSILASVADTTRSFGGQIREIWDISDVGFVLVTVRTILILTPSRQGEISMPLSKRGMTLLGMDVAAVDWGGV